VVDLRSEDPRLPPGPHGRSRQFVLDHQRERLISAMVEAVNTNGYLATSVADVLALARVSRSAFYELFRDKEDCFLACYDRGTGLLSAGLLAALAQGGPWQQRIRRAYAAVTATFAEHPHLARVCMVEALAAGPAANARYQDAIVGIVAVVEQDMADDPAVQRVPRLIILGVVGGVAAIIHSEILAGRTEKLPAMAPQLARFHLACVSGYDDAKTCLEPPRQ
jgi:AcrR family transcriptional regulator